MLFILQLGGGGGLWELSFPIIMSEAISKMHVQGDQDYLQMRLVMYYTLVSDGEHPVAECYCISLRRP